MNRLRIIFSCCILVSMLYSTKIFSQEFPFQREIDTIPVFGNSFQISWPFTGGLPELAKSTFADIDSDGDFDMVVGTGDGNLNFYRNTGTDTNPKFTLEEGIFPTNDWGGAYTPTFADIDGDGDLDLFIGKGNHGGISYGNNGRISFYRNNGTKSQPSYVLETGQFNNIDVGGNSAPEFVDIDSDGDLDLFIGKSEGKINYYRNTGTNSSPEFELVTDYFGALDVGDYSVPVFADIDNDGDFDLFVGEKNGTITFMKNEGTTSSPVFNFKTNFFDSLDIGSRSAPSFIDIDSDGKLDLFIGEEEGNLNYYKNTGTPADPIFTLIWDNTVSLDFGKKSIPAFADIDNDGDSDLFVGEEGGNINFLRNDGSISSPSFTVVTYDFESIDVGEHSAPSFVDIDNDGDLDLFVGEYWGKIKFYRNIGTPSNFEFTSESTKFDTIYFGAYCAPSFADIDKDGDFDLFIAEASNGSIHFYRNIGSSNEANFVFETTKFAYISGISSPIPSFADIDSDGDLDLFLGEFAGNIHFYRNNSTPENPYLFPLETAYFASINVGSHSSPVFVDIDNDGDLDIFVGEWDGGLNFYRNYSVPPLIELAVPDTFGMANETVQLPIRINNGLGVAGAEIKVTYDSTIVTVLSASTTTLTSDFTIADSVVPGKIAISMACSTGLTDVSGDFVTITLHVSETADSGAISPIHFELVTLYDEDTNPLSVTTQDGNLTVISHKPIQIERIYIQPSSDTLNISDSKEFSTYGKKSDSSEVSVSVNWVLEKKFGNIGSINPGSGEKTTFTATGPGDGLIKATYEETLVATAVLVVGKLKGDINIDDKVNVQDAIRCLQIIVKNYTPSLYQIWAADFDGSGGFPDEGDALGILNESLKGLLPKVLVYKTSGAATVRMGSFIYESGDIVTVPILIDVRDDVFASGFEIHYNSQVLTALSATSSMPSSYMATNFKEPGTAKISLINTHGLVNSQGEIIKLKFKVSGKQEGNPELNIKEVRLFDRQAQRIEANVNLDQETITAVPKAYNLHQNYPNPFNPTTTIRYDLPEASEIKLIIYNMSGQVIKTLASGKVAAGSHSIVWDGRDNSGVAVPSGVYFYKLSVESQQWQRIKKMVLIK